MKEVDRIISDCVDTALSASGVIDVDSFYVFLKQQHDIDRETIGSNFQVFHDVLKQLLGSKHYRIEQLAIRTLHERTKHGTYTKNDELMAFDRLVNTFIKDADESIKAVRDHDYLEISNYVQKLEATVKQAQAKLRETERLAIIGQTAGMVGHDIRNPLQAIIGDLYLLKDELKKVTDSETKRTMQESIESIDENVIYINKIVSDLQDYTRPLKANKEEIKLKELINGIVNMLKIPENIEKDISVDEHLTITADITFLKRALSNLILNASQAMEQGGKLTLKAYLKGAKVVIVIVDSGNGIPEEAKQNLFLPLFTTKPKGQGLGLAVVKRFIEALNGTIVVESEKGNGAKFIIELPIEELATRSA